MWKFRCIHKTWVCMFFLQRVWGNLVSQVLVLSSWRGVRCCHAIKMSRLPKIQLESQRTLYQRRKFDVQRGWSGSPYHMWMSTQLPGQVLWGKNGKWLPLCIDTEDITVSPEISTSTRDTTSTTDSNRRSYYISGVQPCLPTSAMIFVLLTLQLRCSNINMFSLFWIL